MTDIEKYFVGIVMFAPSILLTLYTIWKLLYLKLKPDRSYTKLKPDRSYSKGGIWTRTDKEIIAMVNAIPPASQFTSSTLMEGQANEAPVENVVLYSYKNGFPEKIDTINLNSKAKVIKEIDKTRAIDI